MEKCIEFDYTAKNNSLEDFLFSKKVEFLTESHLRDAVQEYLNKIPKQLLNIFSEEGWTCVITNTRNLEKEYGYNFEIYGLTDYNKKQIIVYATQDGINFSLSHELGHFLDCYLGNISNTQSWKYIYDRFNTNRSYVDARYFSDKDTPAEYFANCFLLYVNDKNSLKRISSSAYEFFEKTLTHLKYIREYTSRNATENIVEKLETAAYSGAPGLFEYLS